MTEYISPILGEIPKETFENFITFKSLVKDKEQMKRFIDEIKRTTGFGVLRTGVLWMETQHKRVDIRGYTLELYLNSIGYPKATDLMKLLALNQTLINDIISEGINIKEAVYGFDIAGRLKKLGLAKRIIYASYAREMLITIYPVLEIEEELPPPPPEICYRTQLAYLYIAKTKKGRTPDVIAEFRVWGVSNEIGKYQISKFDRVIMQMERIFKGEGYKPIKWLASIEKVIKASEEDEEIDCDEVQTEINYALRGAAFRDEIGKEEAVEYDEKWIKHTEKKMIDAGQLITRFDNESGTLINVTEILKKKGIGIL